MINVIGKVSFLSEFLKSSFLNKLKKLYTIQLNKLIKHSHPLPPQLPVNQNPLPALVLPLPNLSILNNPTPHLPDYSLLAYQLTELPQIESAVNTLTHATINAFDSLVPLKSCTTFGTHKPWVSASLRTKQRHRDKLYGRAIQK